MPSLVSAMTRGSVFFTRIDRGPTGQDHREPVEGSVVGPVVVGRRRRALLPGLMVFTVIGAAVPGVSAQLVPLTKEGEHVG